MRALTFASLLAVSMAGVACSDNAPVEPENVAAETETPDAAETGAAETAEASQFNLRFPGSDGPAAQGDGGFNLRAPTGTAQPQDGFRLPEGAVREDAFSNIPEIRTPAMDNAAQQEAAPDEDPEDEIIRLD